MEIQKCPSIEIVRLRYLRKTKFNSPKERCMDYGHGVFCTVFAMVYNSYGGQTQAREPHAALQVLLWLNSTN